MDRRRGLRLPSAICLILSLIHIYEAAKRGIIVSTTQVRSNGLQLAKLGNLFEAGMLRVAIDSTFPLAEAKQAHERVALGHIQGKIALTVL